MQIIMYTLFAFGLVGFACTFLCVLCGTDLSELLPVYNPRKKKVGATFWGAYGGLETVKPEETFKLPKLPENDAEYLVGSTKYAAGKAVKSARS
jgi:hypothetical protein